MLPARLTLARQMSERELQQAVYDAARLLGFRAYHTHTSRHSAAGFPDLVLLKGDRCIAVELKRQGRAPTVAQMEWLLAFERAGAEAHVFTPSDWLSGEVERILRGE